MPILGELEWFILLLFLLLLLLLFLALTCCYNASFSPDTINKVKQKKKIASNKCYFKVILLWHLVWFIIRRYSSRELKVK